MKMIIASPYCCRKEDGTVVICNPFPIFINKLRWKPEVRSGHENEVGVTNPDPHYSESLKNMTKIYLISPPKLDLKTFS